MSDRNDWILAVPPDCRDCGAPMRFVRRREYVGKPDAAEYCCPDCGSRLVTRESEERQRRELSADGHLACTEGCVMTDHVNERPSALDPEALRRLNDARRDPSAHWNARELARNVLQSLLMRETDAILTALTELERFRAALREIRDTQGKVCDTYEICDHRACASSYDAWAIAAAALAGVPVVAGNPSAGGQ